MVFILSTFHSHCSADSLFKKKKNEPESLVLTVSFPFPPGCPEQDSDIAFLIDGSGSIDPIDFERMKRFVSTVMSQFQKSKTLVSANG